MRIGGPRGLQADGAPAVFQGAGGADPHPSRAEGAKRSTGWTTSPSTSSESWGRLGYFGIRYPAEIGGMGADCVTFTILAEEVARVSMGLAAVVTMQCLMGTDFIHHFGTEGQKAAVPHPRHTGREDRHHRLYRARLRLRPGVDQDEGRQGRRQLRAHGQEDVDHERPGRRLRHRRRHAPIPRRGSTASAFSSSRRAPRGFPWARRSRRYRPGGRTHQSLSSTAAVYPRRISSAGKAKGRATSTTF